MLPAVSSKGENASEEAIKVFAVSLACTKPLGAARVERVFSVIAMREAMLLGLGLGVKTSVSAPQSGAPRLLSYVSSNCLYMACLSNAVIILQIGPVEI